MLRRDSNTIKIANFYENYKLGKYDFEPSYQRRSVWSDEKKSFLIDSIIQNFPIPPVFLKLIIDDSTGSTKYEVIDGKQRLESIIEFIENKISISSESDEEANLAGKYFKDLDSNNFSEIKASFWRYVIPIEYIDTPDNNIIDNIFDRLNRNGEPLTGQELRHAKYNSTELLKTIQDFSILPFWKERLNVTDKKRMEDLEFLSELVFFLLEGIQESIPTKIDELYQKYTDQSFDKNLLIKEFTQRTTFLEQLSLDFNSLKINGVSHLYGLWCLADHCANEGIAPSKINDKLTQFFKEKNNKNEDWNSYKLSMSSRTKSKIQRIRRLDALKNACSV